MKDLTAAGIDDGLIVSLTDLANILLAGKTPASVTPILFGGSLIALEKKDGGIRPIAVGYIWRRLTAKCANRHATESLTSILSPKQLGVGVKGGAEAAVHATRRYLQQMPEGNILAKLDFKNAFNSLSRNAMLEAVAEYAPDIYHLCYSAYSSPSILSFGNHIKSSSSEGPQQGDPLGPLLFSITIQPILEKLKCELVIGYLDDITIAGTVDHVATDIETTVMEATRMGLVLNASKCEIIHMENEITSEHDVFENYLFVKPIDASLLGVPILPGPSVDAALQYKCDDLKKAIDRLRFVDAHDAVVLLKNSLHLPKLLYTLRTSMCHEHKILLEIDTITRDGLSEILNLTFTDDQWLQAGLPVKDGGLGVRSVATLALPAFLASAESTDELQLRILEKTAISEDLSRATALESWLNETNATQPTGSASHKQKNWDNVGIELRKTKLLANCNNDRDRARILASRARHAGAWLNALPISTCGLRMSNDVIRAAVGFRLGCRLCEPHLCRCGALVDAYGTHSLACNRSAAAGRQLRHHLINDIIYRSLARANIHSSREPLGLYRSDGRRPDGVTLTPWRAGKCLIWDATSPDTQAASHINGTSQKAGAAAEQAAIQKADKYR